MKKSNFDPLKKGYMIVDDGILFMAFRYALGRATYVVGEVVNTIIANWDSISPSLKYLIQKETQTALDKKQAGWEMDEKQWRRVLELKPPIVMEK